MTATIILHNNNEREMTCKVTTYLYNGAKTEQHMVGTQEEVVRAKENVPFRLLVIEPINPVGLMFVARWNIYSQIEVIDISETRGHWFIHDAITNGAAIETSVAESIDDRLIELENA